MEWGKLAKVRSRQIESGEDISYHRVFLPFWLKIINRYSPKNVLEIGAGTGHLAKSICHMTDRYLAIEPDGGMYETASQTLSGCSVDLQERSVFSLNQHKEKYDLVIAHMVLHAINDYERFLHITLQLLKNKCACVFTIPHPCFSERNMQIPGFDYKCSSNVKLEFKLAQATANHEVCEVPYYHRPIGAYISSVIRSGGYLHEFVEMGAPLDVQQLNPELWQNPRYAAMVIHHLPFG